MIIGELVHDFITLSEKVLHCETTHLELHVFESAEKEYLTRNNFSKRPKYLHSSVFLDSIIVLLVDSV